MPPSRSDSELEQSARAGKRSFIVEVVETTRYRVWAADAEKAEEQVYWRRSSGRPYPDVEDLGTQPRRFIVNG